jgi:hypothetical protein
MPKTQWVAIRNQKDGHLIHSDDRSFYMGHGKAINVHLVYRKRVWKDNNGRVAETSWIKTIITYTSMKKQVEFVRGIRSSKKERIDRVTLYESDPKSGDKFNTFIENNHLESYVAGIQKRIDTVKDKHPEGITKVQS